MSGDEQSGDTGAWRHSREKGGEGGMEADSGPLRGNLGCTGHLGEGKAGRRRDLLHIIDVSVHFLFCPGGDFKQMLGFHSCLCSSLQVDQKPRQSPLIFFLMYK